MPDSAMEPTISAGQTVSFRVANLAQRGQVIAFEYPFAYPGRPRRELIARVIGVGGDELELGPGGVIVNGQPLPEPYAKSQQRLDGTRLIVPAGTYFVLGDDRANQRDSRWWGPLPSNKLLGVAEPPP
jgi:signal peptidase I